MNGTSVMKNEDGDGHIFLSQISDELQLMMMMVMIESRSQICERTSVMKNDDGDGDMLLSQVFDIYFDRKII